MADKLNPMPFGKNQPDEATPLGDDDLVAEEAQEVTEELGAIDLEENEDDQPSQAQIQAFGTRSRHDESWSRTPNVTGQGAIHVKTFHAKLREDALAFLDQQVNEWLDSHPEYEVKFVTTTIGELKGKLVEPALFLNVWV